MPSIHNKTERATGLREIARKLNDMAILIEADRVDVYSGSIALVTHRDPIPTGSKDGWATHRPGPLRVTVTADLVMITKE